eukprot:1193997-Alexandrium_andersonii.AAC.1
MPAAHKLVSWRLVCARLHHDFISAALDETIPNNDLLELRTGHGSITVVQSMAHHGLATTRVKEGK